MATGRARPFQALLPLFLSVFRQTWAVRAVSWVSLPYLLRSCGGGWPQQTGLRLGQSWGLQIGQRRLLHTNPIYFPLCRLLRLCFLESNLHFGSPLCHLTICCFFFRWKTKNILLSQMMMGSWTVQVLAGELCTVCPTSQLCLPAERAAGFSYTHLLTKSKLQIVGFTFLMN